MQHSAQRRSATHTAEHTRAQEHTGSTAAHNSARPAPSCMHIAHSTAQHSCSTTQLQPQSTPTYIFSLGLALIFPLPPQRIAQQGRPPHSKASLKAWQTNKSHSTAMQHSAQQRSATHSTMSTEHTVFCPHCPTIFWNPSCTCDVCHGFAARHLLQRDLRIKPDGSAQNKYD